MYRTIKKVTYKELLSIPIIENHEILREVNYYDDRIGYGYEGLKKPDGLGEEILVRDTISRKLAKINFLLEKEYSNLVLKVCYGYRPPLVQSAYFTEMKRTILSSGKSFISECDLNEEIHKFVAVPKVAGHPAGAAIDLSITDIRSNLSLDMGGIVDDFTDLSRLSWFAKGLTSKQQKNRLLLLKLMLTENFAPFWGEWWHYSYGDLEWAAYYKKKYAIYREIKMSD